MKPKELCRPADCEIYKTQVRLFISMHGDVDSLNSVLSISTFEHQPFARYHLLSDKSNIRTIFNVSMVKLSSLNERDHSDIRIYEDKSFAVLIGTQYAGT